MSTKTPYTAEAESYEGVGPGATALEARSTPATCLRQRGNLLFRPTHVENIMRSPSPDRWHLGLLEPPRGMRDDPPGGPSHLTNPQLSGKLRWPNPTSTQIMPYTYICTYIYTYMYVYIYIYMYVDLLWLAC